MVWGEETGQGAVGHSWDGGRGARQGMEPRAHYRALARRHNAPRLKPPFNDAARRAAGFTQAELDTLVNPEALPTASGH